MARGFPGPGDLYRPDEEPALWECQSCGNEQEKPGECEKCEGETRRIQ